MALGTIGKRNRKARRVKQAKQNSPHWVNR